VGIKFAVSPYWITSSGLASETFHAKKPPLLSKITRAGIKGILKVSDCFITFWQRHSNDFRLQSLVDLEMLHRV